MRLPSARGGKVVAVTATEWTSAKSATAAALARAASRARLRVAVVDLSLDHPTAARAFGIPAARFGLMEALTGRVTLAQALCRDPRSYAQVLSATSCAGDANAVLVSARMANLVAYLRRNCDLVILDAPPAGRSLDAVSALSDAVLVVARDARSTAGLETLSRAPLGVVLAR
jgi:Mrp family chromosome partitioning ATPase